MDLLDFLGRMIRAVAVALAAQPIEGVVALARLQAPADHADDVCGLLACREGGESVLARVVAAAGARTAVERPADILALAAGGWVETLYDFKGVLLSVELN